MKLEHIVALAVRLFAIVLGLYALRNGVSLVPFFHGQEWEGASYLFAGGMAVLFLVAVYLWKYPFTVSRGLVAFKEPGDVEVESATASQLEVAGFTILGLYLAFSVLSDLSYWAIIWFVSQRNSDFQVELSIEQIAGMVATAIEFIFVLFLLLGAKRMRALLRQLRYGGDA